jgi:hypothetical protein
MPSWVCSKVSMVTRERHFLQMNCCAIGTRKCYPARLARQMTNYCPPQTVRRLIPT